MAVTPHGHPVRSYAREDAEGNLVHVQVYRDATTGMCLQASRKVGPTTAAGASPGSRKPASGGSLLRALGATRRPPTA